MRTLHADARVTVLLDPDTSVIRFVRSASPYASNAEMAAIHAQIGRVLDRLGRDKHALLVDMRLAPMNNDPSFEQAAERARSLLVRGFPRVAVLVQTAVGTLQVKRHVQQDGRNIAVMSSEAMAVDYLIGKVDPTEMPPSSKAPGPGSVRRRRGR